MSITLVGIDLETGGLDGYQIIDGVRVHGADYYPILEFGVIVADESLNVRDQFSVGVAQSHRDNKRLSPWALEQHTRSGLLNSLMTRSSKFDYIARDIQDAEGYILSRLWKNQAAPYDHKTKTGSVLFGNSIAFDANFMNAQTPKLAAHFHYRRIDISVIDMLSRTAWNGLGFTPPQKEYAHTALEDIKESLGELQGYTDDLSSLQKSKRIGLVGGKPIAGYQPYPRLKAQMTPPGDD